MVYANTGPFTNNVVPPGISATFLNNVENFLDTITTAATDSNFTSAGSGNLATTGTIQMANNKGLQSKDSGGTVRAILTLDSSNNLVVKAGGNNAIRFLMSSGTEQAKIDGTGINLSAGTFSLLQGSLSRISKDGPFTVTTTLSAFSHGLGAVPDFVIVSIVAGSVQPHNVYVEYSSLSSSQVKMQSDGTITVYTLCLKF